MNLQNLKDLVLSSKTVLKNGFKIVNICPKEMKFDDGTVAPSGLHRLLQLFVAKPYEVDVDFIDDLEVELVSTEFEVGWRWRELDEELKNDFWEWIEDNDIWFVGSKITLDTFKNYRVISTILNNKFRPAKVARSDKFNVWR